MNRYKLELTEERHHTIKSEISSRYNLGWSAIESRSRKRAIIDARRLYCGVLRNVFGLTFHQIGEMLNKNHATIVHSYEEIESMFYLSENYYEHEVLSVERKMDSLAKRLSGLIEKKNEYKLKIKKQNHGRQELCSK
mgnify:CR=1 FL=1